MSLLFQVMSLILEVMSLLVNAAQARQLRVRALIARCQPRNLFRWWGGEVVMWSCCEVVMWLGGKVVRW